MSTNTLKQALEIVYGDIKNISKRVKNLESASVGVLYTETTKSAVAYQDNVSANACPYALLNKVGGMSYKSENLVNPNDELAGYSIDATTGEPIQSLANGCSNVFIKVSPNTTYTLSINQTIGNLRISEYSTNNASGYIQRTFVNNTSYYTFTTTATTNYVKWSLNINNQTVTQQKLNDLNICLVKGNDTTYTPYFEGIRDSAVISVISKDSNGNILATGDIPNEIQALEGYGQSNPDNSTEYNYIDFENKTFVRVGYIDNGAWVSSALTTDISQYINDNSIQIEANGTITFTNIYQQAIPYEYLYLEKVGANNE